MDRDWSMKFGPRLGESLFNGQGEPATSYIWNGWGWEIAGLKLKSSGKLPLILKESVKYTSNESRKAKRCRHATGWNWTQLGSRPIMTMFLSTDESWTNSLHTCLYIEERRLLKKMNIFGYYSTVLWRYMNLDWTCWERYMLQKSRGSHKIRKRLWKDKYLLFIFCSALWGKVNIGTPAEIVSKIETQPPCEKKAPQAGWLRMRVCGTHQVTIFPLSFVRSSNPDYHHDAQRKHMHN